MKRTLAVTLLICSMFGRIPPVLRLHVIAHSDSAPDQSVKLLVRDAIVAYLQDDLANAGSLEEAKAKVQAKMEAIRGIADAVLVQHGLAYKSDVSIAVDSFPDITYGGVDFPAGRYYALRVVLGRGQGHNWWCVLFPPLCLVEAEQTDPNWQPSDGVTYKSWFLSLFQ